MGYDITYKYALEIPRGMAEKAIEALRANPLSSVDDPFYPGILIPESGSGDTCKVVMVNLYYEERAEEYGDNVTIWDTDDYVANYTRNVILSDDAMREVTKILAENGVKASGYIFTSWDDVEYWYDVWIDGEYCERYEMDEIGDILVNHTRLKHSKKKE